MRHEFLGITNEMTFFNVVQDFVSFEKFLLSLCSG
jgi:hypothetical protein